MKNTIGLIVQLVGDFERSFEMRDCLDIGGTLQSEVSHLALPLYRNFAQAHFGEMVGDNLWFRLRSFRNFIPQRLRNPAMEHCRLVLGRLA